MAFHPRGYRVIYIILEFPFISSVGASLRAPSWDDSKLLTKPCGDREPIPFATVLGRQFLIRMLPPTVLKLNLGKPVLNRRNVCKSCEPRPSSVRTGILMPPATKHRTVLRH